MKIVMLLFFITSVYSSLSLGKHVESLEDFYLHTQNHVENVTKLSLKLVSTIRANPTYRSYIKREFGIDLSKNENFEKFIFLTKKMGQHHDLAKLDFSQKKVKLQNGESPLIYSIYKSYGKKLDEETINRLNQLDKSVMADFYKQYNLKENEIKFLQLIEEIADKTERFKNPVTTEEMGRKVISAVAYSQNWNSIEIKMIKDLETLYPEVATSYKIKALSFKSLKTRLRSINPELKDISTLDFYQKLNSLFTLEQLENLTSVPEGAKIISIKVRSFISSGVQKKNTCQNQILNALI